MRGWGLFFFLLFLLLIFGYAGWIGWTQYKARKAGLPPPPWKHYVPFMKSGYSSSATNYPTPRSSGPVDWIKDQIAKLRNPRSAQGAYEDAAGGGYAPAGTGRGRGRGFEDDTWDTRVGGAHDDPYYASGGGQGGAAGAYNPGYEEQELGLAPGGLHAEPYGGASDYNRGRQGGENPFGDQNEAPSLRSVSPRPETDQRPVRHQTQGSLDSMGSTGDGSPTGTRKSAFREGEMR